jgi:hypothetical protein
MTVMAMHLFVFAHAQSYQGKLLFDTTERRDFEALLVAELADALSLPVRNFSIEEVSQSAALFAVHNLPRSRCLCCPIFPSDSAPAD